MSPSPISPAPTARLEGSQEAPNSFTPTPTAVPIEAPLFAAGTMLATTVDGLRVRAAPGTAAEVLETLPFEASVTVRLGPLPTDGQAWYLVHWAVGTTPGEAIGGEGWIAAGTSASPWLSPSGEELSYNGYIASFAGTGSAAEGPVEITDWNHGVRWAAVGTGCSLRLEAVSSVDRAPIISTTVTGFAAGESGSDLFLDHPELVGPLTIAVTSNCAWAVTVIRFQG